MADKNKNGNECKPADKKEETAKKSGEDLKNEEHKNEKEPSVAAPEEPKEEPINVPENYEDLTKLFIETTKKNRELEKEVSRLKISNAKFHEENENQNNKYLLLLAELQNKDRVVGKQLEMKQKNITRSVLSQFFPIVESIEAALKNKTKLECIDNPALKNFLAGIENIHKNIVSIYENNDVREMKIEIGKTKFNVTQHEVIYQHVTPDYDDDVILQVSQKGYMIGSDVLRAAKVTVAQNSEKEKERERKAEDARKKREEQRKKEAEEREKKRKEEEELKKKEEEEKKKEGDNEQTLQTESKAEEQTQKQEDSKETSC